MALAVTKLTEGVDTDTEPSTTASISPTNGAVVYAFVLVAEESATGNLDGSLSISGAGLTWNQITKVSENRRILFLFRGTGTPSAGALTLDYTPSDAAWTETMWSIVEVTGHDSADPDDAAVTAGTSAGTALSTGDVGTPGAGDLVLAGFGIEGGAVSASADSGTELTNLGGGSDVRTLVVFYDDTATPDETPGVSWTGTNSGEGIGMIVNVGAAGGDPEGPLVGGKLVGRGILGGRLVA